MAGSAIRSHTAGDTDVGTRPRHAPRPAQFIGADRHQKDSSSIGLGPSRSKHVRANNFLPDKLSIGRIYKMLTVLNALTQQASASTVRTKMGVDDDLEAPGPLVLRHGTQDHTLSQGDPESAAEAVQDWPRRAGIKTIRICSAPRQKNGNNERFNGTLRPVVAKAG